MWSFHGSAVVGTYIFGFVVPNLVLVAVFIENRASVAPPLAARGQRLFHGNKTYNRLHIYYSQRSSTTIDSTKERSFLTLIGNSTMVQIIWVITLNKCIIFN